MQSHFEFQNDRGQILMGVEWLPPSGAPWARLLFHHGVADHTGRYAPVLKHMAEAGVACYSFDIHGHGRSEPKKASRRCYVESWTHLVDDVYACAAEVEKRLGAPLPPASTFVAGQSLGGLVAALAALRDQGRWAGLLLCSGAMGVDMLRLKKLGSGLLLPLAPKRQLAPAYKPSDLHEDPAVVRAYLEDPLIYHGWQTGILPVRTSYEVLKAIEHMSKRTAELKLPVFATHAARDAITSVRGTEKFIAGVSSADKLLVKVEGASHEALMGAEKLETADTLLAWMQTRAAR